MNNNDPTRYLTPPLPAADLPENGFTDKLAILDHFSPSYWLFEIIHELAHVDVLGELVSPLAGQWAQVSAYGDALSKLSRCLDDASSDLADATELLRPAWQGNAAQTAFGYFTSAAGSINAHAWILNTIQSEYRELSLEMWKNCEAMKDIVEVMLDYALTAAIFAALGTATAPTGVGPAVGYSLAALQAVRLVEAFHRAMLIVHSARGTIQAFTSSTAILTKQMTDIRPVAPIGSGYDHPMVS